MALSRRCWYRIGVALAVTLVSFLVVSYGHEIPQLGTLALVIGEASESPDYDWANSSELEAGTGNWTDVAEIPTSRDVVDGLGSSPVTGNATTMPSHLVLVNSMPDAGALKPLKGRVKHLTCPESRCVLSYDKKLIQKANAVVFNPLWPIFPMPSSKPARQLWVYSFHFEAPETHGFAQVKKPTIAVSPKIDLTMTFQSKADIFRPFYVMKPYHPDPEAPAPADLWAASKKKYLLIWLVSNCGSKPRMKLFRELRSRLGSDRIHLYGGCGTKLPCRYRDKACERKFFGQYKFYAAFENSRCDGYITEKFFRAFQMSMVPLAYGGMGRSDYERIAPKKSFLHVDDFGSPEDLANSLKKIDQDDERYNRFHEWRKTLVPSSQSEVMNRAYCEVCDRIDHPKGHLSSNHDLHKWFFHQCTQNQPFWNSHDWSGHGH